MSRHSSNRMVKSSYSAQLTSRRRPTRGTSSFLTFEIFAFSCLYNIVVAYNIIFDSVSIVYLSVSRSIDGGPAFSTRENLDPRFPVPRFPPPYFSWSPVFHSRVFSVP